MQKKWIDYGRRIRSGPTILFYHGVMPAESKSLESQGHHSVSEFGKQMQFLSRYHRVISLSEFNERSNAGAKFSSKEVVVTFDDGYKNNLTYAAPILKKYGVAPSLFISTKHVETGQRFPTYFARCALWYTDKDQVNIEGYDQVFDTSSMENKKNSLVRLMRFMKSTESFAVNHAVEQIKNWLPAAKWCELERQIPAEQILSWREVKELADSGWEIGSHCHDHAILHCGNNRAAIRYQLNRSLEMIMERIGYCKFFAYPNGERGFVSGPAIEEVEKAGYALGLSAEAGDIQGKLNRYLLPRRLAPRKMLHFVKVLHNSMLYRKRHAEWVTKSQKKGSE